MNTKLEQAARQALSVINGMDQYHGNLWKVNASPEELDDLCTALREALEEAPQPARQPLTDEQVDNMVATASLAERDMFRRFARAVERAHGIGGEA